MKITLHHFTFTTLFVIIGCQQITVMDYNQDESRTRCSRGLIEDVDEVSFKCLVDYSQDTKMKFIVFQIKRKHYHQFNFLTDCNIQDDCNSTSNTYGKRLDTYEIEVTIRLKASVEYNGAKMRAVLITSKDKEIASSEIIFPDTSDFSNASGNLIINGNVINNNGTKCLFVVTRSELNVVFVCESEVLPCLIEISSGDLNDTLRGTGHVTFNKILYKHTETIDLQIKYGLCRLDVGHQIRTCKVTRDDKTKQQIKNPKDQKTISSDVVIILCVTLPMSAVGLTLFICCLWKYKNKCSKDIKYETCYVSSPQDSFQLVRKCKETGRYTPFIPINKITNNLFSVVYHKGDFFKLIRNIANLTVEIYITYISSQRPDFYPETNEPYPLCDKRGSCNSKRHGTGIVKHVNKSNKNGDRTCPCYKCQQSMNPSRTWGYVNIHTAKSLVFDDSEAYKSICSIILNNSTESYILEGVRVIDSDINDDQCLVECVTCNEDLLNTLDKIITTCIQQMTDVNDEYNNFVQKDNLTIIVFQHDNFGKYVTLGHWTERYQVRIDGSKKYTKYVYTTPTCQECIGAFVFILGKSDFEQKSHVHCGVYDDGNGYSSTGIE
ncbi:unnamed protein product [Lymnaea stagnalis]|uniref:Uncharacterized protein n=1 Tax=Lymnaea stagnalis TaxID=6523 RepID=A0AAV2HRX6_LYMST